MNEHARTLLDRYWEWFRENHEIESIDQEWIQVTTPYIDRHNDFLQVCVKTGGDAIIITDDHYIITDLKQCGCELNTPKRRHIVERILRGFGLDPGILDRSELTAETSAENFPQTFNNIVQAMLAVNDLHHLAPSIVEKVFRDDISDWLSSANVPYDTKVPVAGKSGFEQIFDFVIPASAKAPERIIQALPDNSRRHVQDLLLAWVDTEGSRSPDAKAYALLNDRGHGPTIKTVDALLKYDISPVRWSERDSILVKLVA